MSNYFDLIDWTDEEVAQLEELKRGMFPRKETPMKYRVVSLDTAADEPRPSDFARLMQERPTPRSEQGTVRRTSNGNLIPTTRR